MPRMMRMRLEPWRRQTSRSPILATQSRRRARAARRQAAFTHFEALRGAAYRAPRPQAMATRPKENFVEDKQGDEKEWEEEIDLLETAGEIELR